MTEFLTFEQRRLLKQAVSDARLASVPHVSSRPRLSGRERQIVLLAEQGLDTPQIAARIGLAFSTTADYLRCARVKLELFKAAS